MSNAVQRLRKQLAATMTDHLATGDRPHVPEAGRLAWQWFSDLCATRTYHQMGPEAISNGEIQAWATLNRWPLQPHHVAMIRALDEAWLADVYKGLPGSVAKPAQQSKSGMNAGLFDVLWP